MGSPTPGDGEFHPRNPLLGTESVPWETASYSRLASEYCAFLPTFLPLVGAASRSQRVGEQPGVEGGVVIVVALEMGPLGDERVEARLGLALLFGREGANGGARHHLLVPARHLLPILGGRLVPVEGLRPVGQSHGGEVSSHLALRIGLDAFAALTLSPDSFAPILAGVDLNRLSSGCRSWSVACQRRQNAGEATRKPRRPCGVAKRWRESYRWQGVNRSRTRCGKTREAARWKSN